MQKYRSAEKKNTKRSKKYIKNNGRLEYIYMYRRINE